MDVVYIIRPWFYDCIELRYSLRSLKNFEYDRVIVVGHKPKWVTNVIHYPVEDVTPDKFKNVRNKYKFICNKKEISDDFLLMHDDWYILRPIKEIKYYILWSLKDYTAQVKARLWTAVRYFKAIETVYKLFPDWDCFDVHCPIVFNKKKLDYILKRYKYPMASRRSIYCNHYKIKWESLPNIDWRKKVRDVKYKRWDNTIYRKWQLFLSTDDSVIRDKPLEFVKMMNKFFPEKSNYEK